MNLNNLPIEHPDRNRKLVGCFYCSMNSKLWRQIDSNWKIANFTFNDLDKAWTERMIFAFEKDD